ncbi:protease modulator HflC [Thalassobacillus hwangdonensis]|uniref:Protein HflC n=1 Tax=Thalassobacillus hwangdonensis TaxID=546108 RepID=A0ABW3L1W5_9BACI
MSENGNVFDMKKKDPINFKKYVKLGLVIVGIVVLLLLALTSIVIVKEGEYKVIRQFGEVVRIESEPGLKFKVPLLQEATTLPKKKMVYDVEQKEINTLDKKRIIIDNYAVWHVTEPENMIRNAKTVLKAEARMGEFIFSIIRSELGQLNYEEIINDEEHERGDLHQRIKDRANQLLEANSYGIRVDDIRIKRTDLPEENEQAVYNRMISERESKAQQYLSQGEAEKNRIIAQTDRNVTEMLAKANADAAQIRAEGEQEAAKLYNEAFSQDTEFYQLYRTLESYKTTVDGETTIILPQNSPYAELLLGFYE